MTFEVRAIGRRRIVAPRRVLGDTIPGAHSPVGRGAFEIRLGRVICTFERPTVHILQWKIEDW